jgi:hypothetical protein
MEFAGRDLIDAEPLVLGEDELREAPLRIADQRAV